MPSTVFFRWNEMQEPFSWKDYLNLENCLSFHVIKLWKISADQPGALFVDVCSVLYIIRLLSKALISSHICMYSCKYESMYVRMHACIHACMSVCQSSNSYETTGRIKLILLQHIYIIWPSCDGQDHHGCKGFQSDNLKHKFCALYLCCGSFCRS